MFKTVKKTNPKNCEESRLTIRINSEQMLARELIQVIKTKELESLLTTGSAMGTLPETDNKMGLLSTWSDSNILGLDLDLEILLKRI